MFSVCSFALEVGVLRSRLLTSLVRAPNRWAKQSLLGHRGASLSTTIGLGPTVNSAPSQFSRVTKRVCHRRVTGLSPQVPNCGKTWSCQVPPCLGERVAGTVHVFITKKLDQVRSCCPRRLCQRVRPALRSPRQKVTANQIK